MTFHQLVSHQVRNGETLGTRVHSDPPYPPPSLTLASFPSVETPRAAEENTVRQSDFERQKPFKPPVLGSLGCIFLISGLGVP